MLRFRRKHAPHGFIKRLARVDYIGDDHGVKWNCHTVVARNHLLSDKEHRIGTLIDNGDDRDPAVDSRQYGNFGQVRLSAKHEILEILRRRLQNDPDKELRDAAEQQRQITRIRLTKWLSE